MGIKLSVIDAIPGGIAPLGKAYSEYGANMGRKEYRTADVDMPHVVVPVHIRKVDLDDSGYDEGGAYWGYGTQLWVAEHHIFVPETEQELEGRAFLRAFTIEAVKEQLASRWNFEQVYINDDEKETEEGGVEGG